MKRWQVGEVNKALAKQLSEKYGLPVFTSMLLAARGITEEEQIRAYFDYSNTLDDPMLIKDMDKAVRRIVEAVTRYEKICIYGDYDCDGITSTALLYSYLDSVCANVMYYIPDRGGEGYGMNKKAVEKLSKQNVRLIITVDNGISAIEEVDYAASLGMDVIVTDHHKPQDILPRAVAVVDPHRKDDTSPFEDYCGAGLALKLIIALDNNSETAKENYAELAAIGTIADLVPLSGENRKIVREGLRQIPNSERIGITALLEDAQISKLTAGNIGFRFAPRINAAGRLATPYDAMELFLTEDEDQAQQIAARLSRLNAQRQDIEKKIFEEICAILDNDPLLLSDRVLIISSSRWHAGVIGIVSSAVTERYGKPSIIIAEGDDICKGSGRSVTGFSIIDAIFACSDLLDRYGGHPMAAGLSIQKENIAAFRKAMNDYADQFDKMPLQTVRLDCNLNPSTISLNMVEQLKEFEPFGYGNPKPVFGINTMRLDKITPVGDGKHLKLSVSREKSRLNIMKFFTTAEEFPYAEGDMLDFAVSLDVNEFRGTESLSFVLKDMKISGFNTEQAMYEIQLFDDYQRGKLRRGIADQYPLREDFAAVYIYLKNHPRPVYSADALLAGIRSPSVGAFKLLMILTVLNEVKIISFRREGDVLKIQLNNMPMKIDLHVSSIYRKLKGDIDNVREST